MKVFAKGRGAVFYRLDGLMEEQKQDDDLEAYLLLM
jgi:hypothetical protein